jgi:hypothetical protein
MKITEVCKMTSGRTNIEGIVMCSILLILDIVYMYAGSWVEKTINTFLAIGKSMPTNPHLSYSAIGPIMPFYYIMGIVLAIALVYKLMQQISNEEAYYPGM